MTSHPGTPLTERPAWKALEAHHREVRDLHLRDLFARDPGRAARFTREAVGLYADFSKHRITDETLPLLVTLAEARGLRQRIDAMFRGDKINVTEERAVLHVALRAPRPASRPPARAPGLWGRRSHPAAAAARGRPGARARSPRGRRPSAPRASAGTRGARPAHDRDGPHPGDPASERVPPRPVPPGP